MDRKGHAAGSLRGRMDYEARRSLGRGVDGGSPEDLKRSRDLVERRIWGQPCSVRQRGDGGLPRRNALTLGFIRQDMMSYIMK